MLIKNTDAKFKFNIEDITNTPIQLNGTSVTLKIDRREDDYSIKSFEFPCIINLDGIAEVTIPKSYLNISTTYEYQLILKTAKGTTYSSHIDSFFVCDGL